MKNSGLFLNMAKWCFLGLFFEVLILKRFVFGVSAIVSKSVKNACFSQCFDLFWGVVYSSIYFGFGSFRCFCVSCVCFCFLCCFCFCFVCLFLFCCWIVFGVGSCFAFVFFSLVFLFLFCFVYCFFRFFFGGFKGQVRWPKGPPHLALNPPFFLFFVVFFGLFFLCLFFCFCFFWRV